MPKDRNQRRVQARRRAASQVFHLGEDPVQGLSDEDLLHPSDRVPSAGKSVRTVAWGGACPKLIGLRV